MNILVLDPNCVVVEAEDDDLCALLESYSFRTIRVPFQHVHSLGGSFHCATYVPPRHILLACIDLTYSSVDVRREATTTTLDVPAMPPLSLPIAGPTLCLGHALKSRESFMLFLALLMLV